MYVPTFYRKEDIPRVIWLEDNPRSFASFPLRPPFNLAASGEVKKTDHLRNFAYFFYHWE
jgi:hypothetical protein